MHEYHGKLREFPDKSPNFGLLYGRVYGPLREFGIFVCCVRTDKPEFGISFLKSVRFVQCFMSLNNPEREKRERVEEERGCLITG